ncbi:unnamed protein product, partial [Allacma fusca]
NRAIPRESSIDLEEVVHYDTTQKQMTCKCHGVPWLVAVGAVIIEGADLNNLECGSRCEVCNR